MIILFAIEKVSVHVHMLYYKCRKLAIEVLSVHAGLRRREVWCVFN